MIKYNNNSQVEEQARLKSNHSQFCYSPTEKIGIVEVSDFPSLGKITALRFLEWLQLNPEGLVCLPTGKTPEYFIKWTTRYLNHWNDPIIQKELYELGINTSLKPNMRSYTFVQIDEFFPMNPEHENSFLHYIKHFYFNGFGFDESKALTFNTWTCGTPQHKNLDNVFDDGSVDLSLRFRQPKTEKERIQYTALMAIDEQAMRYEEAIEKAGGIGFFLGGIGPDGHIGFNIRGSDHFSTTRTIPINYETAASAATDLGGIELSRQRLVITIGLKTITNNSTATAIIIAAGESKAIVIKNAIEQSPSLLYPATSLQDLPGAKFYLTQGAANQLVERKKQRIMARGVISEGLKETIFVDVAYKNKKPLNNVSLNDLQNDYLGKTLIEKVGKFDCAKFGETLKQKFEAKINAGVASLPNKTFLHTAPHHDDIMLGYLPYAVHLVRDASCKHFFATMTSGFTSVSNVYFNELLEHLRTFLPEFQASGIVKGGTSERSSDVYEYLDAVAAKNSFAQQKFQARRLLRNIMELVGSNDYQTVLHKLDELWLYSAQSYPGKKDSTFVQTLKGMIREWEEELWWGHLGFDCNHTYHLRLGFYTGDIFTQQPELDRDVKPILNLLEKSNPDIVTVAMDPEASGPDTHYKVLQGIAQALELYLKQHPNKNITIWGYRNVWFHFHPVDTNLFVPVSMNSFAILKQAFKTCFGSQRSASFPSYEYDGPFSDLAQQIMVKNFDCIKTCIGADYFQLNESPRLRATHGMCFIKSMTPEEFFAESNALKKHMEINEI